MAVLVPIALGLLVAAGIGTAREGGHAQSLDKPKPVRTKDPPRNVKHDTSPPLRTLKSKPSLGRNNRQEHKIPVPPPSSGPDPVIQNGESGGGSGGGGSTATKVVDFDGVSAEDSLPPDPNGAVGPNYYVQIVNQSFRVFNKNGTPASPATTTYTLFQPFGAGDDCADNNDGDATVVYDRAADRFVISQFAVSGAGYYQCVAISKTGDPTGAYWIYEFQYNDFPDYPKLGVWPDAYYVTFNLFGSFSFLGPEVCAYDRAKMLLGQAATQQCFLLPQQYGGLLPSDVDGPTPPPAGAPNYVLNFDTNPSVLNLWKFHVDWVTPANTTLSAPTAIPVANFSPACGGSACISQKGSTGGKSEGGTGGGGGGGSNVKLDSLGDRLMYRLAYRNFGDHESLVVSHAVTAGSGVGERWYELRITPSNAAGTPAVYQQGTYAPDSKFRWMGSAAMSGTGDIALGYSRSSSSDFPGLAYTGRLAGDTLGLMTQGESVFKAGGGSQTDYDRWGDYSSMSVDPTDDCTFWYTGEYLPGTGSFNWRTRIVAFRLPGCGGGGGGGGNALANGDFESGSSMAPWVLSGKPKPKQIGSPVHGGAKAAQLGSSSPQQGDSTMKQTVAVPAGSPHLVFWYLPKCKGTLANDQISMQIKSTGGSTLATVLNVCQNLSAWQQVDVDMSAYAGTSVQLVFNNHDDGKSGQATYFDLDDVSVG